MIQCGVKMTTEKEYEKVKKKVRGYLLKKYYEGYPVGLYDFIGSEGDHDTRILVKRAIAELLKYESKKDLTRQPWVIYLTEQEAKERGLQHYKFNLSR